MRKIAAGAVLVALISLLTGAAGAGAQSEAGEDKKLVLRIGDTNDIDGFNPFKLVEVPSFEIMDLTYDLLVDFSPKDSSPVPGLADSWEHSKDGLTWTFHLNKDAKWQDGKPVTSEDVAYTFNRILDEKQGLFIDYVKQIDKIETPDRHTVVFTTKKPSVQMLSMYVCTSCPSTSGTRCPGTRPKASRTSRPSGPARSRPWSGKKASTRASKPTPTIFGGPRNWMKSSSSSTTTTIPWCRRSKTATWIISRAYPSTCSSPSRTKRGSRPTRLPIPGSPNSASTST